MEKKKEQWKIEEEEWLKETNQEIKDEFDQEPKYLLVGLRQDKHYNIPQQDEIEVELLQTKRDIKTVMSNKYMQWKQVRVYEIGKPIIEKVYGKQ